MNSLLREITACATAPAACSTDGRIAMHFTFPPSFLGFQGHFPDRPILPGMVQIMAGVLTAGRGTPLRLIKISRAKFTRIIEPGELVTVTASISDKNGLLQATVEISVQQTAAAVMTLTLDPEGERV